MRRFSTQRRLRFGEPGCGVGWHTCEPTALGKEWRRSDLHRICGRHRADWGLDKRRGTSIGPSIVEYLGRSGWIRHQQVLDGWQCQSNWAYGQSFLQNFYCYYFLLSFFDHLTLNRRNDFKNVWFWISNRWNHKSEHFWTKLEHFLGSDRSHISCCSKNWSKTLIIIWRRKWTEIARMPSYSKTARRASRTRISRDRKRATSSASSKTPSRPICSNYFCILEEVLDYRTFSCSKAKPLAVLKLTFSCSKGKKKM